MLQNTQIEKLHKFKKKLLCCKLEVGGSPNRLWAIFVSLKKSIQEQNPLCRRLNHKKLKKKTEKPLLIVQDDKIDIEIKFQLLFNFENFCTMFIL